MIPMRRHTLSSDADIPRHGHARPYGALVLEGGYEEAGEAGRYRVEAGDVLIHAAFSSHMDRAPMRRTVVLNLPLPLLWAAVSTRTRAADPDAVARLAERDIEAAGALLREGLRPGAAALADAPDALARALSGAEAARVQVWAEAHDIDRATAFRRFRAVYGVGPARFRVEARARRAWRRLVTGGEPLADIAAAEGFADQAHMSRDIRALTGRPPGAWRAGLHHSFKTVRI